MNYLRGAHCGSKLNSSNNLGCQLIPIIVGMNVAYNVVADVEAREAVESSSYIGTIVAAAAVVSLLYYSLDVLACAHDALISRCVFSQTHFCCV